LTFCGRTFSDFQEPYFTPNIIAFSSVGEVVRVRRESGERDAVRFFRRTESRIIKIVEPPAIVSHNRPSPSSRKVRMIDKPPEFNPAQSENDPATDAGKEI
jgi:hypothetical protein